MKREPVLITGVAKRLGLELALHYLDRGWDVIGTYRNERAGLIELRKRGAELYRCDFEDESQLRMFIDDIKERHPRLRAIVHNASDWAPDSDAAECGDVVRRMMQVHVVAPYQLNRSLAPLLEASESEHADIIHVGEYVSSRGSQKHIAGAASKAAQDNLTLSFSAKLAPKVKVNSVAPALMMFNEGDSDSYREKALGKSLLQREGGVDEFLHAIDYLLGSSYVTGRVLPMDGGRHLA